MSLEMWNIFVCSTLVSLLLCDAHAGPSYIMLGGAFRPLAKSPSMQSAPATEAAPEAATEAAKGAATEAATAQQPQQLWIVLTPMHSAMLRRKRM